MPEALDKSPSRLRWQWGWALGVFGVLAALALVDHSLAIARGQQALQAEFEHLTQDIALRLKERLQTYERGLAATRSVVIAASLQQFNHRGFAHAVQSLQLKQEFPGARGLGFIRRLTAQQEAGFLASARVDGLPEFTISQFAPNPGERLVIQYLEPMADNAQALGLDIASESNRSGAAWKALRSGRATLTQPITLAQASGQVRRGLLFMLPVYLPGLPIGTEADRLRAAFGLTYAPLVIDDVLADLDGLDQNFSLVLTDLNEARPDGSFFRSARADGNRADGPSASAKVSLYGVEWQIQAQALPAFAKHSDGLAPRLRTGILLAMAALLSVLTYLLLSLVLERRRVLRQQRRMAEILTHASEAFIELDAGGKVVSWNHAAQALFGLRPGDSTGRHFRDLCVASVDPLDFEAMVSQIHAGQAVVEFGAVHRDQEGNRIDVKVHLSGVAGPDGRIAAMSASVRDRSLEHALERELRAAVSRAQLAAQVAGVGIWVWLVDDGSLHWDERMWQLHGEAAHAHGDATNYADWMARVIPADRQRLQQELIRFIEDGGTFESVYRIVDKMGQVRWIKAAARLQIGEQAEALQVIGVNSDITETMAAQAHMKNQALELERKVQQRTADLKGMVDELEAFSYSVSHDLRAPLRAIDGFSNILLNEYAARLDAQARGFLVRVRDASQRMGRLIDDLIGMARLGRTDLQVQEIDLSAMAQEVIALLRDGEPYREVEVSIQPGMHALADSRLMRVILTNLLSNAWKFTVRLPVARLEFGSQTSGGRTEYFVRDNGAGFDMRYYSKLFAPFQRLHQAQEFSGTGIGLATVQRALRRLGGGIRAVGEVGGGASFYFWIGVGPSA